MRIPSHLMPPPATLPRRSGAARRDTLRSRDRGRGRRGLIRQSSLTTVVASVAVLAGLLLDITIAASFGAGKATDAFFVAARIPIGMQAIVIAAANQVLVPAFSRLLLTEERTVTWRLASTMITATLLFGVFFVIASSVSARPLMRITAPGLGGAQVRLAASMVPVVFAVFPVVTASEVLRAVLNARYAFVGPAAMNIVYNGVAVGVIAAFAHHDVRVVAWALLAGALGQFTFMLILAFRAGFRFTPSFRSGTAELGRVGKLTLRPLIAGGTNPLARIGEQIVISFLPTGSITIVSYGYRLISAIGGTVFFRSVMVALLPRLTEATARGQEREAQRIVNLGIRLLLGIAIPLTVLMAVLSRPLALVVFQRGRFTRESAILLGAVLVAYSASLIGSAVQRALLAPFFARLDTGTPLRNTVYGVAANLALLPLLVYTFGLRREAVIGVAIAYSLAQYVNVAHAAYWLIRTRTNVWSGLGRFVLRISVPALVCAAVMIELSMLLHLDRPQDRWSLLRASVVVAAAGLATLTGVLVLLMGREMARGLRLFLNTGRARPRLRGVPTP